MGNRTKAHFAVIYLVLLMNFQMQSLVPINPNDCLLLVSLDHLLALFYCLRLLKDLHCLDSTYFKVVHVSHLIVLGYLVHQIWNYVLVKVFKTLVTNLLEPLVKCPLWRHKKLTYVKGSSNDFTMTMLDPSYLHLLNQLGVLVLTLHANLQMGSDPRLDFFVEGRTCLVMLLLHLTNSKSFDEALHYQF